MAETCYTLVNTASDWESPNEMDLRSDLEKGGARQKAEALKKLILMMLNGEKFPNNMLMTIIRYILPCQDHEVKKLLLVFWEIVPKRGPDGKLLHEMILVCDAYRKDLQHPNEFIRGSTLRFLCKLREPELLEPLMPCIRQCLEHRHSYVRRNAVLAIYKICINSTPEHSLVPDGAEVIMDFLSRETDASCKRNAFLMLMHLDQDRALDYLSSCLEQIGSFNDILQLVIVELIYKVCVANPAERSRFIRAIYSLLQSSSSASVRYEAAATLVTLSQAPAAIKAAANCFVDICLKESDNNVKLIVLDRLVNLKEQVPNAEKVLQEMLMDILRVLQVASDLEVKEKVLNLCLELVNNRNVEEMVNLIKKEVNKTQNEVEQGEETAKYQYLLVSVLDEICVKYPQVFLGTDLMETLFDLLVSSNKKLLWCEGQATPMKIVAFIREFIHTYEPTREKMLTKLLQIFPSISSSKIHRGLLWILGEYIEESQPALIFQALSVIRGALGEIPIVDSELSKLEPLDHSNEPQRETLHGTTGGGTKAVVTADGSYATQSALQPGLQQSTKTLIPPLRSYLLEEEFFIGTSLANCLVKLALKLKGEQRNYFYAECMLVLASILHLGRAKMTSPTTGNVILMNDDDFDRIALSLVILNQLNSGSEAAGALSVLAEKIFIDEIRLSSQMMMETQRAEREDSKSKKVLVNKQVETDDHIAFAQLLTKGQEVMENQFEVSLSRAISGAGATATTSSLGAKSSVADLLSSSKLSKVTQLTGFSDPIYAECYVNVNQYDIWLDVLIVNQSDDTLQNCTLELATLGDLKLVEKPQPVVLAPHDFINIKSTVKVSSTENGVIFGNIVYDVTGSQSDRNVVVLNDISIDIMDCILPQKISDIDFLSKWLAFEWENKVTVNTTITDLREFLEHISRSTNMECLTPEKALSGDCGFLAANLYAKSIIGEDALANVSIEKASPEAPITGHVRMRAKSQGMALSLGEKIKACQKAVKAG